MMCDFQPETKNNPFPTPNLWAWLAPYDRIPSLIFHPMKSLHSWNWAWTSHKFDYMKTWGISVWMQNFRLFSSEEKWGSPCDHMELAKPINWELQFGKSEQIGKFEKSTYAFVILSSKVSIVYKKSKHGWSSWGQNLSGLNNDWQLGLTVSLVYPGFWDSFFTGSILSILDFVVIIIAFHSKGWQVDALRSSTNNELRECLSSGWPLQDAPHRVSS